MGGHGGGNPVMANVISNQDMPPKGGYPKFNTKRTVIKRGPPGWAIWGGILSMSVYGMYRLGGTNVERRKTVKELRDARMGILPFLMAEDDRMLQNKIDAQQIREKEIMKDVEGFTPMEHAYKTRWMPPTGRFY
mmetsp:Transcript_35448/g.33635  ORF Transcript_35448/g.33635 Transcript_35448/m.33635 type:complete len:134 (+) Transcript_35448:127-528(+)|eukprot:CAMPEP_0119041798 /NCGR_PEP_ID=MMETSP1177-20130426/13708_1 /TAXON_ID=2985 /ORGANISM="Ochromonas sp, Strain CCMP1899" /LENGTH=133 /DNA_ID=CAMNT_0007008125 /DNA_START=90 /DNA_END=491 /DNA_ORIENTATION=+